MLRLHFIFKFLTKVFKFTFVLFWAIFVFIATYNLASADVKVASSSILYTSTVTTFTIPPHDIGDIILVSQCASGRLSSVPSGWTLLTKNESSGTGAGYCLTAYKFAQSNSESSGTWANTFKSVWVITSTDDYPLYFEAYNHINSPLISFNIVAKLPSLTLSTSTNSNLVIRGLHGHYASFTNYCASVSGYTIVNCLDSNPPRQFSTSTNLSSVTEYNVNTGNNQGWSSWAVSIKEYLPPTLTLAPALPDDYNSSMPPYKFATTSCETVGDSSICTMAYKPEFYYMEIMFVIGLFLFIWIVVKK